MKFTAAVITMSDKGAQGLRKDTSGPAICEMLEKDGLIINNLNFSIYQKDTIYDDANSYIKNLLIV